MKKYLFMAVAGMLALSSCSKNSDELVINEIPQEMTFTAGYPDGDATRAAIKSDKSVTWETGDRIKVFSAKNSTGASFSISSGPGTKSATFTGTAVADSKFYAVYPFKGTSLDGTTIKAIWLSESQNSVDDRNDPEGAETWKWDKINAISVAVANPGEALQFKTICAVLKVKLTPGSGYDEDNVKVRVQANEIMADQFDYDTADGTITRLNSSNANNYVEFKTSTSEERTRNVYICILPGTYNNFNLKVTSGWSNTVRANKTKSSVVTFEAGKVYDLGTYTCSDR